MRARPPTGASKSCSIRRIWRIWPERWSDGLCPLPVGGAPAPPPTVGGGATDWKETRVWERRRVPWTSWQPWRWLVCRLCRSIPVSLRVRSGGFGDSSGLNDGLSWGAGVGMIGRDENDTVSEPFAKTVAARILSVPLYYGPDAWGAGNAAKPCRFLRSSRVVGVGRIFRHSAIAGTYFADDIHLNIELLAACACVCDCLRIVSSSCTLVLR